MQDKLENGARVETIEPPKVSRDWDEEALKRRRWNISGTVIGRSDAHGHTYQVEHAGGGLAWYERRELRRLEALQSTPEEREVALGKMRTLAESYYREAVRTGCHAFIEFAGLMNEFIQVCARAHRQGHDFPFANTHSGTALPFEPYNLAYLAEKLNCIYGPALLSNKPNRDAFISGLFEGEFKLQRHGAVDDILGDVLRDSA